QSTQYLNSGEEMKSYIVISFLLAIAFSQSSFGFHTMDCISDDGKVTSSYVSDAGFGDFFSANLSYSGVKTNFSISDVPPDKLNLGGGLARNNIAVIPFKTGENLVFGINESSVFAYDSRGKLLGQLKCHLH
ncbi:MAG: hypothetical protein ACXVCY_13170, partial [Pseudobdellovibrionaceae bacterium]